MDHLMVGLEAIIALAFMTCIIDLDAYKLHLGDEKVFTDFSSGCYGLTLYIYDSGSLIYSKVHL